MSKIADTKYEVIDLIAERWSPRSFSNKPVDELVLFSLFEAASWAASSRNEQPWRFICGVKGKGQNYQKIFQSLVKWNQKWAQSAPVLIIGIVKTHIDFNNQENTHAYYDLGQSLAMLSIQATANNLYIHQMGGFEPETIKRSFNIPDGYIPFVAAAIGYMGQVADLTEDLREMEEKPRYRNDLEKIVFFDEFKPI